MYKYQGLVKDVQVKTGVKKSGDAWKIQNILLEVGRDVFPISVWDEALIMQNEMIEVDANLVSREYQGRYYLDLKAVTVKKLGASSVTPPRAAAFPPLPQFENPTWEAPKAQAAVVDNSFDDELPF